MSNTSLIDMIPAAANAVTAWNEGTQDSGTFEITDQELTVLSYESRDKVQDALVQASHAAGYVIEWRRQHEQSKVVFSWQRLPWAQQGDAESQ